MNVGAFTSDDAKRVLADTLARAKAHDSAVTSDESKRNFGTFVPYKEYLERWGRFKDELAKKTDDSDSVFALPVTEQEAKNWQTRYAIFVTDWQTIWSKNQADKGKERADALEKAVAKETLTEKDKSLVQETLRDKARKGTGLPLPQAPLLASPIPKEPEETILDKTKALAPWAIVVTAILGALAVLKKFVL